VRIRSQEEESLQPLQKEREGEMLFSDREETDQSFGGGEKKKRRRRKLEKKGRIAETPYPKKGRGEFGPLTWKEGRASKSALTLS